MINGRLYGGALPGGLVFGHVCIVEGGELCSCGRRGCLEDFGDGAAFASVKTYKKAYKKRRTGCSAFFDGTMPAACGNFG